MQVQRNRVAARILIVLAAIGAYCPARADDNRLYPQTISVSHTYNSRPFAYRIESCAEKEGMVVYRLTYPSPIVSAVRENNTVPAEYYVPKGIEPRQPKRPAVICLHILNGNFELERMCCTMLASHGIPALVFKLPYYDERGLPGGRKALAGNPDLFVSALAQGVEDVRRTVDLLASRPEVHPERIGAIGISLGGILAATVAGQEPRLWRTMPILAGGDVIEIIRQAAETRQLHALIQRLPAVQKDAVEAALRQVDPLRHAAGLRDRAKRGRVLMVNAADDRVIPRACTEKLAAALGISDRVVWLEGLGHYSAMAAFPEILKTSAAFFAEDLPAELKGRPVARPTARRTPTQTVAALLQDMAAFGTVEPAAGRCHLADLELAATTKEGKPIQGRVQLVRGRENRFRIEADVARLGAAAMGQGRFPWIASRGKIVFRGSGSEPGDPWAFVDPKNLVKLRVVAGAVAGMSLAPDMLDQVVAITDDTRPGSSQAVRIARKQKRQGAVRLVFKADGRTPQKLEFDVDGVRGSVEFRAWQINAVAHDALFDPPAGLPEQEVDRTDLYRVFCAMVNFALENAE